MKNLIIILFGACLLACHNSTSAQVENSTYANSVITKVNIDCLQGKVIPVYLDKNERVFASFIANDNTCELLVGYIVPKYNEVANFAHRKIVIFGKSGRWDRNLQTTFKFKDGHKARLVPVYSESPLSIIPKKSTIDDPLDTPEEFPIIKL